MHTLSRVSTAALAGLLLLTAACRSQVAASRAARTAPAAAALAAQEDAAAREARIEARVKLLANFMGGVSRELNDDPDRALEHYFESALADPSQEDLVLEVSRRLLQRQDHERAVRLLEAATATPNAAPMLWLHLGQAHAFAGRLDAAATAYRTALKKQPRLLAAYQGLVQIHLKQAQPAEALKTLDTASQLPDLDAPFLVELAELYAALARAEGADEANAKARALATLNRALALKPENPFVLQKAAQGYKLLGELGKATEIYLSLLERFPRQPLFRQQLTDLYLRSGDRQRAIEQLEALAREYPTNPAAHYFLGGLAAEEKQYDKASDYYQRVLLLNPDFEPVYYELAALQIMRDKPADALATLDKASERFKASFLSEFYRGMAYYGLKQYDEAIKRFLAAEVWVNANTTEGEPPNLGIRLHYLHFQLGAAYERSGHYAEAEKAFRKCLELAPDFAEALNYLGYMWAERGVNLNEAHELLQKAVALEPTNAAFLDSLGWVLFKLDQPQAALKYLLDAVAHSKEPDATILDHLGDVYTALKQYDKAREAWKKSLEAEPNELVRKKLEASPTDGASAR